MPENGNGVGLAEVPLRDKGLLVARPEVLARATGVALAPNTTSEVAGIGRLIWLRPDQWLMIGTGAADATGATADRGGTADRSATADQGLGKWCASLVSESLFVVEAGARFVEFALTGPAAADLLATGCSLDLRERAFAPGRCAQTRIEQVPVIVHREAFDRFTVIVERPLSLYLWRFLEQARTEFVATLGEKQQ